MTVQINYHFAQTVIIHATGVGIIKTQVVNFVLLLQEIQSEPQQFQEAIGTVAFATLVILKFINRIVFNVALHFQDVLIAQIMPHVCNANQECTCSIMFVFAIWLIKHYLMVYVLTAYPVVKRMFITDQGCYVFNAMFKEILR